MVGVNISAGSRVTLSAAGRILLVVGLLFGTTTAAFAGAGASLGATSAAAPSPAQGAGEADVTHLVVENVGQFASGARFLIKQGDQRVWLADGALWLAVPDPLPADVKAPRVGARIEREVGRPRQPAAAARAGTAIRFTFPGANPAPAVEPYGRLATRVSYLIGNDPALWESDVPAWSGVRYRDLYPGVDLIVGDTAAGAVPWRLEAQAGADLSAVALRVEGAESVAVDAIGLRLGIKGHEVGVALPGWTVSGDTQVRGSIAIQQGEDDAFALAPSSEPLAVRESAPSAGEATLVDFYFATLGGSSIDQGYAVAADIAGNTYITGETLSTDLPFNPGPYDPANNGTTELTEAFVAKFNADGTTPPVYITYLGGSGRDIGWGIAVHGDLAFVTGETTSPDFPGFNDPAANTDIFVAAFNAAGTGVRYVSQVGGTGVDIAYGIAVDGLEAYLVGSSTSAIAGTSCIPNSNGDLFVAKLNASGGPGYTSCFNYPSIEAGWAIAVRKVANQTEAYVTGETLPTPPASPNRDLIVVRFDGNGTLAQGRFYDASGDDWGSGIAVDGFGNVFVTGTTYSDPLAAVPFPVTAGTAGWGGGESDAFVMWLRPGDLVKNFATYLGGDGNEESDGIAVDTVQGLYVSGTTSSATFPMTPGSYDEILGGAIDGFLARMHLQHATAPDKVTYATYLGGANDDWAEGNAIDTAGHAFVTGGSSATPDWESTNAFVAKVKAANAPPAPVVTIARSGNSAGLTWLAVGTGNKYHVLSSAWPYFQAGDPSSKQYADQTTTSFTDTNALVTAGSTYYLVKTVATIAGVGLEASENSNRVGKFTYPLVKGN